MVQIHPGILGQQRTYGKTTCPRQTPLPTTCPHQTGKPPPDDLAAIWAELPEAVRQKLMAAARKAAGIDE